MKIKVMSPELRRDLRRVRRHARLIALTGCAPHPEDRRQDQDGAQKKHRPPTRGASKMMRADHNLSFKFEALAAIAAAPTAGGTLAVPNSLRQSRCEAQRPALYHRS